MRGIGAVAVVVLVGAAVASPASAAPRHFGAVVAGVGSGPGHDFIVGNGLELVFKDRRHDSVRYKVCIRHTASGWTKCYTRITGRRGHRSAIFRAAPETVGNWTATWYAHGRRAASWAFYIGPGD
jgi:hypothetical protein